MSTIDDLRARQRAKDEWYEIASHLSRTFVESLKRVKADVDARSGLKSWWGGPSLNVSSGEDSCYVRDQACLTLQVLEVGVQLATFNLSIRRDAGNPGSWKLDVFDPDKKPLELTTSALCVPLRLFRPPRYSDPDFPFTEQYLDWIHYLWWRGPEDEAKLTSAILDAIEKKKRPSEFSLERAPRKGWLRFLKL